MRSITVTLVDDLDKAKAADETVSFGLDGRDYEIDLSNAHAGELRKMASRYIAVARRARTAVHQRPGRRTQADRERSRQIRAWAVEKGLMTSERGRIPEHVRHEYETTRRTAGSPGTSSGLCVDRPEDEKRNCPGRLLLIRRVVRPRGHGALPPGRAFLAGSLPGPVVLLDRAILQFHMRVHGQVVVPDGVLGRTAQGRNDGVLAIVFDTHQGCLAYLSRLRAHRSQDDHRAAVHLGSLGPAGPLVQLNLVARPRRRAWLVVTGKRHDQRNTSSRLVVPVRP
jgi:hypothetical protein